MTDAPAPAHGTPPPEAHRPPTSLFDFSASLPDGSIQDLGAYRGRLTLVVNTASRCGFREQFTDLEQLHRRYGDRGFTVLGFPCDQFRHQEPGEGLEVEELCRTQWDLSFPNFAKVDVNGSDAHPLFRWLATQRGGVLGGRIAWNFTKFLVGADGHVIRRYAPPIPPLRIARRIETELERTAPPPTD